MCIFLVLKYEKALCNFMELETEKNCTVKSCNNNRRIFTCYTVSPPCNSFSTGKWDCDREKISKSNQFSMILEYWVKERKQMRLEMELKTQTTHFSHCSIYFFFFFFYKRSDSEQYLQMKENSLTFPKIVLYLCGYKHFGDGIISKPS